jgi:5-formyltetrahydrofolate cyclo-ligase
VVAYGPGVDDKQDVRERLWRLLQEEGAARFPGPHGRIPNFKGAEGAAERLAELPEWQAAEVVKSNPDARQLPVRRRARRDGKTLYMAVPRPRGDKPFVRVDSDPTIKRAMSEGIATSVAYLGHVDLVVFGTVAVNRESVRVGKGGGFSDLELALLTEAGLVDEATTIVTTVHRLQLVDHELPETEHDFRVDFVVTPDEVVRTGTRRRSPGVIWEHLEAAIAAYATRNPRPDFDLRELRNQRRQGDARTLAGLVFNRLGRRPEPGDKGSGGRRRADGRADRQREVTRLLVRLPAPAA